MLSRWLRFPLTRFSFSLHLGALVGIVLAPENWLWMLGILAVNHAILTAVGLWPRSTLLGPNWIRLPAGSIKRGEIAITIDDGPDPEVTPRVLDILESHGAVASFFCIGSQAAQYPELCREIVRRGHAIENHGQNHLLHFALLGPWRMKAEIQKAQDTLTRITGEIPRFFRATAGLRTPLLDPVLSGLGLHLATWTRRAYDTHDGDADRVAGKLLNDLGSGDILLLHDGNAARTAAGKAVILEVLPRLLKAAQDAGLRAVTLRSAILDHPFDRTLIAEAARPYKSAGAYAWHFARGKLKYDPVFAALLRKGLIPDGHVLDIGCGQGLLAACLFAANRLQHQGEWPTDWAQPPNITRWRGLELVQRDLEWGRAALGETAEFVQGDMCDTDFGQADCVVILDVLHYVKPAVQDELLRRVRAALPPGGVLLLRIGDADGSWRFKLSNLVDQTVFFARSGKICTLHCRPLQSWTNTLAALGFSVEAHPMRQDSTFATVLLVARV